MIKRSDKKAFYGVPDNSGKVVFTRMKHFTDLSISKNPGEYTRQYVDEPNERTDVVKYSPSMSFNFDEYADDAVLKDIVDIINSEALGNAAHREVIQVDFTRTVGEGAYEAVKRTFAVIADSEGGGTDAYTYSGTFKAVGSKVMGAATIVTPENGTPDTVETITFEEI